MKKALACFAVCLALACLPVAAYAQTSDDTSDSASTIKYAVTIWGIQEDTYYDANGDEQTSDLTFGPATGAYYTSSYKAHINEDAYDPDNGVFCLHWMTWDEIIAQAAIDPTVFTDCLANGCTHDLKINLSDKLWSGKEYNLSGDGTGVLCKSLNSNYTTFNDDNTALEGAYWANSKIRATLNGADELTNPEYSSVEVCSEDESIYGGLPEEVQNAIVPKINQTFTTRTETAAKAPDAYILTSDKLWLFSTQETGAKITTSAKANESHAYTKLEAETALGTNCSSRVLYAETGSGSAQYWWTRTVGDKILNSTPANVMYVDSKGAVNKSGGLVTTSGYALAFGFSIAGQAADDETTIPDVVQNPVATINGVEYTSLQAALDAAEQGDTIVLTDDCLVGEPVVVSKDVTIDLNGNKIYNTDDIWDSATNQWSLISVQGANLTIEGEGTVHGLENDCYAIDIRDGGSCTINGGTYIGNVSAVYVYEGSLTVNDGEFSIQQTSSLANKPYEFVLNCLDSAYQDGTARISVAGGMFHNWDPANNGAEGSETNFMAEGYTTTTDDDEVWTVVTLDAVGLGDGDDGDDPEDTNPADDEPDATNPDDNNPEGTNPEGSGTGGDQDSSVGGSNEGTSEAVETTESTDEVIENSGANAAAETSSETVEVSVKLDDALVQDGSLSEITIIVYRSGVSEPVGTITLSADNNWSGSLEDLPKYDENGELIEYSIEAEGYDLEQTGDADNGFVVTALSSTDDETTAAENNDSGANDNATSGADNSAVQNDTDSDNGSDEADANSAESSTENSASSAQTGDVTPIVLVGMVIAMAIVAVAIAGHMIRRNQGGTRLF